MSSRKNKIITCVSVTDLAGDDHYYTVELKPAKMSLRLLKTSLKLGLLPKDYLVNLPDSVKSQLCSEVGSSLYAYSGDKVGSLAYSGDKVGDLVYSRDKTNKTLDYLIKWCRAHY
jgi:hypothetical protein